VLNAEGFEGFVEKVLCFAVWAAAADAGDLLPFSVDRVFRGHRRGARHRLADSLALRCFMSTALDEATPNHSTISRTRRLIALDTHLAV
jgi:transposase